MTEAWKRRSIRITTYVGATLLVLFGIAVLVVEVWAEPWVNEQKEARVAELQEQLQRPVRVGPVDLSLLGGRASVEDVFIGAAEGVPEESAPVLSLDEAQVNIGVFRTLVTLGNRPRIDAVELIDLRANLVQFPDGTYNIEQIQSRLATPAEEGEQQPQDGDAMERVRNTTLGRFEIVNGHVGLTRIGSRPGQARVSQINARLEDAGWHSGGALFLTAAVLQEEPNLDLELRVGPMPSDDEATQQAPSIHALDVRMQPTSLTPLAPFMDALGPAASAFERGRLQADLELQAEEGEASVLAGNAQLEDARFQNGEAFDARLDADVKADLDAGRVVVHDTSLQAGEMKLIVHGELEQLNEAPRVNDVRVRSEGLSFDRIRALYPAFDDLIDPLVLRGDFSVSADGSGSGEQQRLQAELSLTEAALAYADVMRKPAGTPLSMNAELASEGDAVSVERLALDLAGYQIVGEGRVEDLGGETPQLAMKVRTVDPTVGPLLTLLPPVQRAGLQGTPGTAALRAAFDGTPERFEAQGELEVADLDVRAPDTRFAGAGTGSFDVQRRGNEMEGSASADFTRLAAVYMDVIDKPAGTPLSLQAKANVIGLGDATDRFQVAVPNFEAKAWRSDVQGSARFENPDEPQIELKAASQYLNVDDFLPEGEEEEEEQEPGALGEVDGTVALTVARGQAAGIEYEDLDARLRLIDGRARAEKLEVSAFGGRLSGTGSELPLVTDRGPYHLEGSVKSMQMMPLLERFAGVQRLLSGQLGGEIEVSTEDVTLAALSRTLTGQFRGSVEDAEFLPKNGYAALADTLRTLARVPALEDALAPAASEVKKLDTWQLNDLSGLVRFDEGAMVLPEPIRADTPHGGVTFEGRLGLKDASDLRGTLEVPPETLELLVGSRIELDQPIEVPFQLEGSLTSPSFQFADLDDLVRPLLGSVARQQGKRALKEGADQVLERLPVGGRDDGEGGDATEDVEQKVDKARERLRGLF